MNKICYIIAMEAETLPLIECFNLHHQQDFFSPQPCQLYSGSVNGKELYVVHNGRQHDRDLVGCEAAAVTTMAAIERLHPDLIICSGTCGGWKRYGAEIGQVYIGNGAMFHDRRVPGDNEWDTQGLGNYHAWSGSAALAERLSLGMGKVTTGSSFDMTAEEEQIIDENGGRLKEMEGAAVGFVCSLFDTPVLYVKGVTNLRDDEEDDTDTFQDNLRRTTEKLKSVNEKIIGILTEQ